MSAVRASSSARLTLLTGPAGSGKTHRALAAIRDAATEPGPRGRGAVSGDDALLVLPTYAHALHVKRVALTRWDARAIFDEPFTTFTAVGERFLPGFRVRALPSAEERDALMEAALRESDAPAFRAVVDRIGFRARLLRLLKEVKQSGLPVDQALARLGAAAPRLEGGPRERLEAFLAAARVYGGLLDRADLEDHEDALRRLLVSLRAEPPARPPRVLAVDGFDDFTPVEEAILDALSDAVAGAGGEVLVTLPWDPARPRLFAGSAPAREHLLGRGFVEEQLVGFPRRPGGALSRLAGSLFGPAVPAVPLPLIPLPPVEGGEEVEVLVAGDPEDEADRIARRIRAAVGGGDAHVRGFRDVAVIVRDLSEAGPRLVAALERLGIPVHAVGSGTPLAAAPLVRALRGPLRILGQHVTAEDFDPHELFPFLRWRAFASGEPLPAQDVDDLEMAFRSEGFPPDWAAFRERASPAVRAILDPLERFRERLYAATGAEALHGLLEEALHGIAPLPRPSGVDEDGRPRDPVADRRLCEAAAALARLLLIARDQRIAAARSGRASGLAAAAVEDLLAVVGRASLGLPDRRLEAVSLLDAEEARTWELPLVFVAGLVEGGFPLRPSEDVILRDEDREFIRAASPGLSLPLAREREVRERRLFYGAVTRARRRLVLSCPAYDESGDPKSPSLFLRDVLRVVSLAEPAPPSPGRSAPDRADCHTREDLRRYSCAVLRAGDGRADRGLAAAILALDPRGIVARAARWRRREADPLPLPGTGEGSRLRDRFTRSVERVSATSLNAAVACLHRHFLDRVGRVPEDDAPFEGPEFDPRDVGTLAHAALRLALEKPDVPPAAVALEVLASAAHVPEAERRLLEAEIERIVALFRDREVSTRGDLVALEGGLETSFGGEGEPPVLLGDGPGRFRLRGKADRIDAAGDRASIVDYKLSKNTSEEAFKAAGSGRDLQLPLYARAVEVLRGLEVVGLEWVTATTRHRRMLFDGAHEDLYFPRKESAALKALDGDGFRALVGRAEAAASRAVAAVRAGDHEKRPASAEECARCAWRTVCRPDLSHLRSLDRRRAITQGAP